MLFNADETITRETLEAIPTPEGTRSWQPVPHVQVLDTVDRILERRRLPVAKVEHALDRDGKRLFSQYTLDVGTGHSEVQMQLGVGNSLDKSLSARIVGGEHVTICSNGMWMGEFTVRRKHTTNVKADLPVLFDDALARYIDNFTARERTISELKSIEVNPEKAAHAIMLAAEKRAISSHQTTKVWQEFREPRFEAFRDPTAWNLQQAFTTVNTHDRRMDHNDKADAMSRLGGVFDHLFLPSAAITN